MGRKASAELREQWVQRLERQSASGLSIAEFCVAEGISAGSFSSWKRRLKATGEEAASAPRQARPAETTSANVSTGSFFQVPVIVGREQLNVEFELVDGTIVRVPAGNFGAIELVLRTVAGVPVRTTAGGGHHA